MTLAHSAAFRHDLPIPVWLAVVVAVCVVAFTFAGPTLLKRTPRVPSNPSGIAFPAWLQRLCDAFLTRASLQWFGLAALTITLMFAWTGPAALSANPAPTWFYVWFWVGMVPLSLAFGNLYRYLNPLRTTVVLLCAILGREVDRREALNRLRYWPAMIGLGSFVWLEVVSLERDWPRVVAVFITAYALVNIAAGMHFGPKWFDRCDGFSVYFSLVARLSPFGRREDGTLVFRSPLPGLARDCRDTGLAPVLIVLLGATLFDGFAQLPAWTGFAAMFDVHDWELRQWEVLGTGGLILAVLLIAALYVGSVQAVARFMKPGAPSAVDAFAHTLIPVVAGFMIAHSLSAALFESQAGYLLISGGGGTNYGYIPSTAIAFLEYGTMLGGLILAAMAARTCVTVMLRAPFTTIGLLPPAALMVSLTILGITFAGG